MCTQRGHSHPKTYSAAPNPAADESETFGIDAATMLPQSKSRTIDPSFLRSGQLPQANAGSKALPKPNGADDECTPPAKHPATEVKKDRLERYAAAHRHPTEGSMTIPCCIARTKPKIFRLATGRSSLSRDVELHALNTPVAPVNKDTMKELGLQAIQNNLPLRIDLCFDDQLYFQPIKGRKGEEKRCRARVFWDCLSLELQAYRHALHGSCPHCSEQEADAEEASDIRIPSRLAEFFSALRDLIEMLVPDKGKDLILLRLDVDHLVRMTRVGHFDAVEFSAWLAELLMTHCAPLRDEMAQEMHRMVTDGVRTNDMDRLVEGLETLLALLENMKLDVANHQVRSFKVPLIADTVPFLKDCFSKMNKQKQLDLESSRRWFDEVQDRYGQPGASEFDNFVRGTVMLCRSPYRTLPNTFSYDKERLLCLQNEVLDLTQLRICMGVFEESVRRSQGRSPSAAQSSEVFDRFLQLISSEDGNSEGVNCHLEEIAIEIARASSGVSPGISSDSESPVPEFDPQQIERRLETCLQDNLHEMTGQVIEEVTERTLYHACQFRKLDTLQVSNAQRIWTANRSTKSFFLAPEVEDMARRIAHIISIHWAVWSDLFYLKDQACPTSN